MRRSLVVALSLLALAAAPPPTVFTTLAGTRVTSAETRGKVLVVHFWATWCAPCRVEMPVLDAVYRAHREQGLEMVAIALDADGSRRKIAAATASYAFAVARLDDTTLPRAALPGALPTTRVYDRDGVLRYDSSDRHGQPMDAATIERVVAPLLAQGAATR